MRRYWPAVEESKLVPDYSGIRPKLTGPQGASRPGALGVGGDGARHGRGGAGAADFAIEGLARHGVPGLVNLFGIESPGLTASLAIAEHVAGVVDTDVS